MGQQTEHRLYTRRQPIGRAYAAAVAQPPSVDYASMFRHAPVGMILSHNRVMRACNDAALRMFGYQGDLLTGRTFSLLYPSADEFKSFGMAIATILQTSGRYADERIMKRANGELFWCRVTGNALRRDDPHAEAIWIFEDLSDKRKVGVNLTPREREISALLIEGKTSKLIARRMGLSPRTVETHKSKLMRKYAAANAIELVHRLQQ